MKAHILTLVTCLLACSTASAQTKTLHVGQVAPLTGPASSIGLPVTQATHAYFNRINKEGGISGHRLELLDRDDAFDPKRTLAHVQSLLDEKPIIALINVIGAPNNGDLVGTSILDRNAISVVGAFTGATSVRAMNSPFMYFVRASVADEARKMVRQLRSLGITDIALVHASDAFGWDSRDHVEKALAAAGGKLAGAASYEPATSDSAAAAATLRALNPQAVLISKFLVEAFRRSGKAPSRADVNKALASIGKYDAGGVVLDYSAGSREGLRTVDIGILSSAGKLVN